METLPKSYIVNWYICLVQGGKEISLCKFINQKNLDLEAFILIVEVYQKKEGKSLFVTKPLFLSYIFIKSVMMQSEFLNILKKWKL